MLITDVAKDGIAKKITVFAELDKDGLKLIKNKIRSSDEILYIKKELLKGIQRS